MKRSSVPRRVFLAALAVLAIGSATNAGERPIKGSGSGHLDYNASRLDANGHVTHLGKSRVVFYVVRDFLDFGEVHLQYCQFIAANGDGFFADILDQHFDPQTGALTATILFLSSPTFEGRFSDAEGAANLSIVFEDWIGNGPYEGDFDFVLDGTIDY
jgi:hypothetical protein